MGLQVNSPKPYMSSDDEILIGDDQKVSFKGGPLVFPALIKNKKIESVKTGKPIFKLPTPKKERKVIEKKDKSSKASGATAKANVNPKSKSSDKSDKKSSPQTPKPVKPPTIENISDTPNEKYSFLKSLAGEFLILF